MWNTHKLREPFWLTQNMVYSSSRSNNRDTGRPSQRNVSVRIVRNYNVSHALIKDLLKSDMDPLCVDPVPTSVSLHNIEIRRLESGEVAITCDVTFETACWSETL